MRSKSGHEVSLIKDHELDRAEAEIAEIRRRKEAERNEAMARRRVREKAEAELEKQVPDRAAELLRQMDEEVERARLHAAESLARAQLKLEAGLTPSDPRWVISARLTPQYVESVRAELAGHPYPHLNEPKPAGEAS